MTELHPDELSLGVKHLDKYRVTPSMAPFTYGEMVRMCALALRKPSGSSPARKKIRRCMHCQSVTAFGVVCRTCRKDGFCMHCGNMRNAAGECPTPEKHGR